MNQTFDVSAMTCGHCEKAVKQAVLKVDPQAVVTIDRSINRVDVISSIARDVLVSAISGAGYTVAPTT